MSWTTSLDELRVALSDGPTDKLRWKKRVLEQPNGVRTSFKTFEFRRITDFTTSSSPLKVFVNDVAATVSADFPEVGEFTLSVAPTDGAIVQASYYIQWFKDSELNAFLQVGSQWLLLGNTFSNVPEGLRPACLKYAVSEAYQKLALRWAEHYSDVFRLEDAQDPNNMKIVDSYRQASVDAKKEAQKLKEEFYTRSGQSLQPLFGVVSGAVSDVMPKR